MIKTASRELLPNQTMSIAMDATPLLGQRTGVGDFCFGALASLSKMQTLQLWAYAVSWRQRGNLRGNLPGGVGAIDIIDSPMPARPLHMAWKHFSWPAFEQLCGKVDVVHGTNYIVPPTRHAARVVTVHDLTAVRFPHLCAPSSLEFPSFLRRAIKQTKHHKQGIWIHTPSEFIAREVVELLDADPERVVAVHHGVPINDYANLPASALSETLPLPKGCGSYVLGLGTIEPRKDFPTLLKAMDILFKDYPEVCLVLAGADGWGVSDFVDGLAKMQHPDRVVRLGYVDDYRRHQLLKGALILAYPSLYEGFGFPPLQAMSLGVPVVTTNAGALPETVGDGGVIVEPQQPESLAIAISKLLADGKVREQFIKAGFERVKEFTWDKCAQGLVSLYERAIDERFPNRKSSPRRSS